MKLAAAEILDERKNSIQCGRDEYSRVLKCDSDSVAGSVSQRACVYCGARVVLNPITDAFHIVHGPIGCASYTWDIRGSLSSGPEIYRNSFSTDLEEKDVIFGGEKKLAGAIDEIVQEFHAKVIFVYATCIVGVIGDDMVAVCKNAEKKHGIRVIPVQSSGFAGNKSDGYKAACDALLKLMDSGGNSSGVTNIGSRIYAGSSSYSGSESQCGDTSHSGCKPQWVNYLGDFNLAGEAWIISNYLKSIGVEIISRITGDSRYEEILQAPQAGLNIVQCAGSMTYLAKKMEEKYGIPFIKVSFFGLEDTKLSLIRVARATGGQAAVEKLLELFDREEGRIAGRLEFYRNRLKGKKAAIFVGGGFKAISLVRQFADLGMKTVMVGTQTGRSEEYETLKNIVETDTVILDDANPAELEKFMKERGADILVGGVKERPLAFKLGVAFCDHNHERKHPLCGFEGAVNFAVEIDRTINSPVWGLTLSKGAIEWKKEISPI